MFDKQQLFDSTSNQPENNQRVHFTMAANPLESVDTLQSLLEAAIGQE
jgi:hypothetical protein